MKNIIGQVVGCTTVYHTGTRKTTKFEVKDQESSEIVKIQIHGRHPNIISPSDIYCEYETHTGVNWVDHYIMYDNNGEAIYSDYAD